MQKQLSNSSRKNVLDVNGVQKSAHTGFFQCMGNGHRFSAPNGAWNVEHVRETARFLQYP